MIRRFSIITPCRNAGRFIEETVRSVLDQTSVRSGRVELEYIVCDGGSTDGTLEILSRLSHPALKVISEPDAGMYDALAKGLSQVTGDWSAYINAGDLYSPYAFDVVIDVVEQQRVEWLTGISTIYNELGQLVWSWLPYRYSRPLISSGQYCRRPPFFLPYIEQESTFWSSSLNRLIDLERLAGMRLAGDYYLWTRFAQAAEIRVVSAYLGGFRKHRGQLSESITSYREEVASVSSPFRLRDVPDALIGQVMWWMPRRIKKWMAGKSILLYDHDRQKWW